MYQIQKITCWLYTINTKNCNISIKTGFVHQMSHDILKKLTLKDDSLTHFQSERKNCVCLILFVAEEKQNMTHQMWIFAYKSRHV